MGTPFMSEIRIMSFNFAPQGWAKCNGQFLPINQNQGLFSLLGTTYGGNGQTTFALPDLRDRVPVADPSDNSHTLGEKAGSSSVTINIQQLPQHQHLASGKQEDGTAANPNGQMFAKSKNNYYGAAANLVSMAPEMVSNVGGSQPHTNEQPYLVLNFCIALQGFFPSQS